MENLIKIKNERKISSRCVKNNFCSNSIFSCYVVKVMATTHSSISEGDTPFVSEKSKSKA